MPLVHKSLVQIRIYAWNFIDKGGPGDFIASGYRSLAVARKLAGQAVAARDALQEAEKRFGRSIAAKPLDTEVKTELTRTELDFADLDLDLGDVEEALEKYRAAETSFAALIEKDAADLELQWFHANAQNALGPGVLTPSFLKA